MGAPRSVDGRLYGRGACDMKGGVAAILAAVRALARSRATWIGSTGELHGRARALRGGRRPGHARRDPGRAPRATWRSSPSRRSLDVVVAHAGAITFRLTVPGRAAHASQRREGVSALDKLFVLTRALEADETRRNAAETDPLMTVARTAVPDDHRHRRRVASGRRPCSTGSSPTAATGSGSASRRPTPRPSCGRASRRRAPATTFLRDHPATVEITGGRFGSARVAVRPSAARRPGRRRRGR